MSHIKPIVVGCSIATAGISIYLLIDKIFFSEKKIKTREQAVEYLAGITGRDKALLNSFDEGYVIAWANATINAKGFFSYGGKNYLTATGKAS